ncbi:TetR/AcrR family transcriptional regulator [Nocardia sp. NBC_00565]|uniref:TetR/AcrR family transcriptional regulator n=1 Tax=Nocardia sp. NBC_00565 TaxID=2975993 RepID=UPI002E819009|nr:helix-turn-helix domain-containing protein [Nocardia sp. NBC_00565]WUC05638.1 TetR/AcrR family transcriptional regulator [Nocardia sp. NBC_00565]
MNGSSSRTNVGGGIGSGQAVADPPVQADRERAAIIRAAHRLIGRHGVATPIEDILRAAKVNRRTFYRHFPSKDALVLAMQREAGELVEDGLRAAVDGSLSGRAAVVAWIEEFLTVGWDERRMREGRTFVAPEVGLVVGFADALEEIYACHREVLAGALARARADGSLPGAMPERDAFAIHAVALRSVEMRARGRLERPYEAVRDDIVGLFVR